MNDTFKLSTHCKETLLINCIQAAYNQLHSEVSVDLGIRSAEDFAKHEP